MSVIVKFQKAEHLAGANLWIIKNYVEGTSKNTKFLKFGNAFSGFFDHGLCKKIGF